ncbi:23S rRNA (pseudouridine(1915)-N(3))-methyltransferase RlmH [Tianweitania sediminis]|uniref:Ribosomal RNA large subunit methyltransferase H n=1 Tax=Tianweitania sediminis TaxID=1502156 RepID=A0A8J7R0G0_9HYPH|nr:23S rRNA (pseudouridine(1915)-N(3))-methyltransferase RlmH [Tianweitania sediminis]MBP0437740.1 23S rRNA (pseudouridine(1915)-N(3))-methyltransferase RlmH [Tianweitania sediminis]
MRVGINAIGRLKAGAERDLVARYLDRFTKAAPPLGLEFSGVSEAAESRLGSAAERMREEASRVDVALSGGAALVLLDERGKNVGSTAFAQLIAHQRDAGTRQMVFAIGGPDGHAPVLHEKASQLISFGAATWPHQLVRVMLAEQLYRAATILSGHPYHRA